MSAPTITPPAASPAIRERNESVTTGLSTDLYDQTEEWVDQLRGWEAELQIKGERYAYRRDRRAERTAVELAAVRTKLHEALKTAKATHSRAAARQYPTLADLDATARRWLCEAHRAEHQTILRRIADAEGLPARMPFTEGEHIAAGWRRGYIDAHATDRVADLEAACGKPFVAAVVADVRRRTGRDEGLRHPLLAARWLDALTALLVDAAERAGLVSPSALSPLPEGFGALPPEDAYRILDARRFYVAVQHRWLEAQRLTRRLSLLVNLAHLDDPATRSWHEAARRAGDAIAARYPDDDDLIRFALSTYARPDGRLDCERFTTEVRGELRREVLAVLAGRQVVAA